MGDPWEASSPSCSGSMRSAAKGDTISAREAPALVPPLAVWVPTSNDRRGVGIGCNESVRAGGAASTMKVTLRTSSSSLLQQACKTAQQRMCRYISSCNVWAALQV